MIFKRTETGYREYGLGDTVQIVRHKPYTVFEKTDWNEALAMALGYIPFKDRFIIEEITLSTPELVEKFHKRELP
jgi:hypothetical protein